MIRVECMNCGECRWIDLEEEIPEGDAIEGYCPFCRQGGFSKVVPVDQTPETPE